MFLSRKNIYKYAKNTCTQLSQMMAERQQTGQADWLVATANYMAEHDSHVQ